MHYCATAEAPPGREISACWVFFPVSLLLWWGNSNCANPTLPWVVVAQTRSCHCRLFLFPLPYFDCCASEEGDTYPPPSLYYLAKLEIPDHNIAHSKLSWSTTEYHYCLVSSDRYIAWGTMWFPWSSSSRNRTTSLDVCFYYLNAASFILKSSALSKKG